MSLILVFNYDGGAWDHDSNTDLDSVMRNSDGEDDVIVLAANVYLLRIASIYCKVGAVWPVVPEAILVDILLRHIPPSPSTILTLVRKIKDLLLWMKILSHMFNKENRVGNLIGDRPFGSLFFGSLWYTA